VGRSMPRLECGRRGEGRLLAVNPAMAEMLGYDSVAELLAVAHLRALLVNPDDHERLAEQFRQARGAKRVRVAWKRKDGPPVTVHLSGRSLTDERGEFDGFEAVAEDMQELSSIEARLRQAQKMEAISQFTGGIAHDFNNLLTVILATADLLAEDIGAERAELLPDIANIRSAAQHGADMARKLLPERIETLVLRDEAVGRIRADTGAVEQVLLNVVTNARDAMPDGGTLCIETRRARGSTMSTGARTAGASRASTPRCW
jgi:two-component system cell cycle sensor histidine kinase/response regulator CckA